MEQGTRNPSTRPPSADSLRASQELRWNPRVVAAGRVAEVEAELARMGIAPEAEDFSVATAGAGLTVALEHLTEDEAGLLARCWGTDGFWEGRR